MDRRCAIIIEQTVYTIIGQRIRVLREQKNWTQDLLGEKVDLTRSSIANIESGKQKVPLATIYLFALVLEVEIFDILPSLKEIKNNEYNNLNLLIDTEKYTNDQLSWVSEIIKKGLNDNE